MTNGMRVTVSAAILRDGDILLIELEDAGGVYYRLPGGSVLPTESATQALQRATRADTGAEARADHLLMVTEMLPSRHASGRYPSEHTIGLVFQCVLAPDQIAHLPDKPQPNQIGVRWVVLRNLASVTLVPPLLARRLTDVLQRAQASDIAFCEV